MDIDQKVLKELEVAFKVFKEARARAYQRLAEEGIWVGSDGNILISEIPLSRLYLILTSTKAAFTDRKYCREAISKEISRRKDGEGSSVISEYEAMYKRIFKEEL